MKICFIIATLENGGAERVLATLSNAFCGEFKVQIIKFDDKKPFYKLNKSVNLQCLEQFKFNTIFNKIISRFRKFFALKNAMKASNADVFISFLDSTNVACIVANFFIKKPLIISEHSIESYLKSPFWRILRRIFYPFSSALTVLNLSDKNYYERFVKNVKIMPNPCEFSICGDSEKENLVIFVGRLDENKNAKMFLKAISNLPLNLRKEYEFCIAGKGELENELKNLAKNLKIKVKFLGAIKDIKSLYERAKILCLCSFEEGLPSVLIESLFFKIARISTNYQNAQELINTGFDGFLVPKNDDKKMAEILITLMQDENLREKITQNALKKCDKFSVKGVKKGWINLIKEIKND